MTHLRQNVSGKLVVIIGPTSSGKTAAAIHLCQKFNGEIVSADSRQIYKFMDIGTGKVPVGWLYDIVKPGQYFSASDFKKLAEDKIKDIWTRHKVPFVVGGTGFYIEMLLGSKTIAVVPPNFELRKELEKLSTEALAEKLKLLDLKRYEVVDRNNRRRLIRAIEIALSDIKPKNNGKYLGTSLQIGFTASHEFLYARVDAWVEKAFQNGLVEETQKLVEEGFKDTPQLQGLIYKTVLQYLTPQLNLTETKQRIKYDLHNYIRRQETFFRHLKNVEWLDISKEGFDETLFSKVQSFLDG